MRKHKTSRLSLGGLIKRVTIWCVSGGHTVDATLIVKPVNTVALAGTSVTLQCTTDLAGSEAQIAWVRSPTTSNDRIVDLNCQLDPAFPQYSVISSSAGQCDLVINNVSLDLAAAYRCADYRFNTADAQLTVIGKLRL